MVVDENCPNTNPGQCKYMFPWLWEERQAGRKKTLYINYIKTVFYVIFVIFVLFYVFSGDHYTMLKGNYIYILAD